MKTHKITIASLLLLQVILSANELSSVDTQVDAIKPAIVGINNNELSSVDTQVDAIKPARVGMNNNELSWVDTQVDAIKPARVGMNNSEILKIQDPFIFYKKKDKSKKITSVVKASINGASATSGEIALKKKSPSMKLSAIINNSALINGKWYKVNQNIAGFIVSSITKTDVVLSKGKKKLVLTTNDQNRNIKFK